MLKQADLAATGAKERARQGKKRIAGETMLDLVEAVMKRNPEFRRLDGVLAGLAKTYLNGQTGKAPQVVGVCSTARGEGKTTVVMGLATALARRHHSHVLLVEGNLGSATLAKDLGREVGPGLAECLRGEADLDAVIQPTPTENLFIITAGQAGDDPISMLGNGNLKELVLTLRSHYSYIIVDMPAVLEGEEVGRLVDLVDGVILVIAAGLVSKDMIESGVAAIGRDKLMGVILNRVHSAAPRWLSRIFSADGALSLS